MSELETLAQEAKVTKLSPFKFMQEHEDRCIYQVKQESSYDIKITECAPKIFQSIRKVFGVSDEEVLDAFSPLNNSQAIRNF